MLRFLLAFVLALARRSPHSRSPPPSTARSKARSPTTGRRPARRHGDGHQPRHRRHPRGRHQRERPLSRAAAAARQVPRRRRAPGLQEVRADRHHSERRPDRGDRRQAARRHSLRDDFGHGRCAAGRPRQDRARPHPDRGRDQDAAADLAQPLQLRAAAAGRGRLREQRVRRAAPDHQRRAAARQLSDRRQQQHAEGSRRPAADADVGGDDPRSEGGHHRLRAGVRPDDGPGLQRDHALGHQHLPGPGQLPLPARVDGRVPVLLRGRHRRSRRPTSTSTPSISAGRSSATRPTSSAATSTPSATCRDRA